MTNISTLDYVENFTISKSLSDDMWTLTFALDKDEAPTPMTGIRAFATDYADVEHCLFIGFIPGAEYIRKTADNKVSITAYDFTWYLTAQYATINWWEHYIAGSPPEITWGLIWNFLYTAIGGNNSLNVTGLLLEAWDESCVHPGIFHFGRKTTWMEQIKKIGEECELQFFILFANTISNIYFLKYENIDTHLPVQVTFTSPSDYVTDLKITENSMEDYNRIIVYGADFYTGYPYTATEETAAVTAGEEKPIEYVFEDAKLDSMAKTEAKALALYNTLQGISSATYSATLTNRYDLKLLQKVKFVGYTDVPETDMRIISISYQRILNNDSVVIAFTSDQSFTNLKLLARSLESDSIQTQQQVIKDVVSGLANLAIGEVTAVDGNEATVTLEQSGNSVNARLLV